jgi:hypothetical protein
MHQAITHACIKIWFDTDLVVDLIQKYVRIARSLCPLDPTIGTSLVRDAIVAVVV